MMKPYKLIPLAAVLSITVGAGTAQDKEKDSKEKGGYTESVMAAQILLDRAGFSTGEIDGVSGRNVEEITKLFQEAAGLDTTGELDDPTSAALMQAVGGEPVLQEYVISEADLAGPFVKDMPEKLADQAKLEHLGYKNVQEALAEKFHVDPELLKRLNPEAKFEAKETLQVPNVESPPIGTDGKASRGKEGSGSKSDSKKSDKNKKEDSDKKEDSKNQSSSDSTKDDEQDTSDSADGASSDSATTVADGKTSSGETAFQPNRDPSGAITITVTKSTSVLVAEDEEGKPVFAAPVTTGSEKDPLPLGEWKVNGTEYNPPFNYNPDLFWDSEDNDKKAKLPPGANGPVGVAWIDLSKEHYGLHGTPEPGKIGHTASHGCVRLTNWDVLRLAKMAKPGTKVIFKE